MPRAIVCVLDSVGIGGAPDAADYGDLGANTLGHIAQWAAEGRADQQGLRSGPLHLPNLEAMGIGAAVSLSTGVTPPGLSAQPKGGRFGVGRETSKGKDTPSGHWEIAGVPVSFDWGYFPQTIPAFPDDLIAELCARTDVPGILGNKHASGTDVLMELGEEHIRTGMPICYTSVDSVFQIAAHESHFGLNRLYDFCKVAFELTEPLRIGRVIARPFVGENAADFKRTGNRRDFALQPPEPTLLDRNQAAGHHVYAIGKISDIYAGSGVTHKLKGTGIPDLLNKTLDAMEMAADRALIMTNFVDFDSEYGHRRDVAGYAGALELFDSLLPEIISRMRQDDLLVITADHGNDPTWPGTDHTREQVPILVFSPILPPGEIGIRSSFADIGETIAAWLGLSPGPHGKSFL
ncbi:MULTISPECIES: phosphopentomutase [unclassified Devosia]|uniref:phosphopentomutase n=1 Tax=unclassified Devosia TaxID=196773 RepID=UPI00145FB617|nr:MULTISPECIES: phosphopentomutase [unclassified Devosia]MBJ6988323.1 phosphopentomutase [Devosia sp. MC521]QMW63060.1 phosphopentomutase [Devosia sp. MC521]